jgi:hypothetical protein
VEPPSPIRPPDDPSVKPRIGEDEELTTDLTEEEEEARKRAQEANASALTLEMIGDLPFANVRPPENILFVWSVVSLVLAHFHRLNRMSTSQQTQPGDNRRGFGVDLQQVWQDSKLWYVERSRHALGLP